ncbi:MAG: hypothetical protein KBB07_06875 [Tepidiphilus sp.]|jgi:hypothetical protein|uniref:FlgO domain-containing protein n=1 Tax=Tepidiphilus thermophilus TaxID=876478 RepID=A0A0K6INU6_9PROT|nr:MULTISPECIES: FlgO family outer membrane protein [Tepidiphilus]MBP6999358.1 hypothetical protein [Tepidiphilus sp.]CUB04987.1 hypothetical protein Ga0061068_101156 [Tepidiphilus thermophilus]
MTFRFSATAAALLTAGLLSACSLAPTASMCREATENELGRMARQTCPRGGSVIIPDFVEVDGYRTGRFGKALGEAFGLAWSRHCAAPMRQVEVGEHLSLDEDGLRLLTRDPESIRQDIVIDRYALVGTYRRVGEALQLGVRRIDLVDGTVRAAASGQIPERCFGAEPTRRGSKEKLRTTVSD